MTGMMGRMGKIVVVAALFGAGSLGVATAHTTKYKSVVEIGGYQTTEHIFLGTVGSLDSKSCGGKRLVTVWKINPGVMDGPFGSTKSKGGSWRLDAVAPSATYYATVKQRTVRNSNGHRHVCKADRSPQFVIP